MPLLNTIKDYVLGIVFPTKCISCGLPSVDLCILCLSDAPTAERESAKWIFPMYDYRHPPIKKALWLFKYKGKKRLASIFAEVLYGRILEELADLMVMENFREPVLIPVPLSGKRYRERGFNQAELICRELIRLDSSTHLRHGVNVSNRNFTFEKNILVKPRDTKHQAHIENRSERLKNIIGSFSVEQAEKIKNRNLILIDDITTTGATLNEARKILKQSGAKKIIAFTVAH